jgi:hypothetical protein
MWENKYNIGDRVYHITPESDIGVVIDWRYFASTERYSYYVVWNTENRDWYVEQELSKNKVFA